LPDC
jgi:hypothetical protein